jgi:hypothetical protein
MTKKGRFLVAAMLTLLMAGQAFAYELLSGPTGTTYWDKKKAYNGYTLFYPDVAPSTALVDMSGNMVNMWPAVGNPTLTDDGYLFGMTGARHDYGDLVMMDWKGKIVKRWVAPGNSTKAKIPGITCSDGKVRQTIFHHDWMIIKDPMKSERTVLAVARVLRTPEDVTAAGLPAGTGGGFGGVEGYCDTDAILEFDMDGNLIWQWEIFDRLAQDYNPGTPSYSATARTDFNKIYVESTGSISGDNTHTNAISFNPARQEVLMNPVKKASFYIARHDISTEQAYGDMGDLVYRWGDPSEYDPTKNPAGIATVTSTVKGKTTTKTIFGKNDSQIGGSHNAHWIPEGLPGAGNFLLFSNAGSPYINGGSAVVEINPYTTDANAFPEAAGMSESEKRDYWKTAPYVRQTDAGVYTAGKTNARGSGVELSKQITMYFTPSYSYGQYERSGFFSGHISGVQRLPNGSTLVCGGETGHFFELTRPDISNYPVAGGVAADKDGKADGYNFGNYVLCKYSEVVWEFVNPFALPPDNQTRMKEELDPNYEPPGTWYTHRPAGVDGQVFRAVRYSPKFSGFKGIKLKAQGPLNNPKKWKAAYRGFGYGNGGISVGGGGGGAGGGTGAGHAGGY